MEEHGPEAKRPRLDTTYGASTHRSQQQQPIAPHSYSAHAPPPRNSYPSGAPPPPSPYYDPGGHEHDRALPHPNHASSHPSYTPHSGHNTPVREQRHYAPETGYSRHGSASATTRSPDASYQPYTSGRHISTTDGHYSSSYASDSANHAVGYPNSDGTMNGQTHGLPMPTYPEQPHAPSGRPSDYGHSPVNVAPPGYPASPYGGATAYQNMRVRKGQRATQACDVCRQRKAKCDEGRPKCSHCVENGLQCNYQTVAPAKADRANQAIMDHLAAQDRKLENFEGMIAPLPELQSSIERIEKFLLNQASPRAPSGTALEDRRSSLRAPPASESPNTKILPDQKVALGKHSQTFANKELIGKDPKVEASPSSSHGTITDPPIDHGSTVSADSINVPVEHTTAAHRLLAWPSIKKLVHSHRQLRSLAANEDYVMRLEEASGVLRVYGRGEGKDKNDGAQPGPHSPAPSSISARSDDSYETQSTPSPAENLWGAGFITPVTSPCLSPPTTLNEAQFDFSLNIHPQTLRRLLDSYLSNIHILHPFLEVGRLTSMVERFSLRYNPSEQKLTRSLFSKAPSNSNIDALRGIPPNFPRPGKSRHEGHTQSFATELTGTHGHPKREIEFERSISTAIVLLVMAMGRICEWKKPLPGVRHLNEHKEPNPSLHHHSPPNINGQSPRAYPHGTSPGHVGGNTPAPSPTNMYRNSLPSPRSVVDDSMKNIDVVPGLSYYAPATDILGNLHGSNDLAHVQAYLLAGLFMGQMARTFESFNWISSACRACRFLVREPSLVAEKEPRANMIRFAFWTCSQLESDILAELDLPRSGINLSGTVSYPKGYIEPQDYNSWDCAETQVMGYYSGQIHIRNQLNDIQKELYAPDNNTRATRGFELQDALITGIEQWRVTIPPAIQWNDKDPPATDINAARLRAKYYGACYIIHRPFLRYALDHDMFSDTSSPGAMAPPLSFGRLERDKVLSSCRTCVDMAMKSTVAFDGVQNQRQRLIVTNIFGTAHAQFGNLLVLSATYKSKSSTLSNLVPRDKLEHLFDRTIRLLRSLVPLSESLERDVMILEALRELIFDERSMRSSFSSDN